VTRFNRRARNWRRGALKLLFGYGIGMGLLFAAALPAQASPNYPDIIDMQLGTDCASPTRCLICHISAAGGEGTAKKPFAVTLQSYGLTKGKSGRQLVMALMGLPDDVDSDGDGTTDKEELLACQNPSGAEISEGPGFGCGAELVAPPRSPDGPLMLVSLTASATLLGLARLSRSPARHARTRRRGPTPGARAQSRDYQEE
jgi:hypothetical protein